MKQKIGIIGIGAFAMGRMPRLLCDPRLELAAVHDLSKCAFAKFQSKCYEQNIPFFRTVESLLDHAPLDLIWITTTAPSHLIIANEILANISYDTTILIEKPISNNLQSARDFCAVCKRSGADVAVDYPRRAVPAYQQLQQILSEGRLGELVEVTVDAYGAVGMNGSHFLDLIQFLTDVRPVEVRATFGDGLATHHRGAQYSDSFGEVIIRGEDQLQFTLNMQQPVGTCDHQITILGTQGKVSVREKSGIIKFETSRNEQIQFSSSVDDWIFDYLHGVLRADSYICRPEEAAQSLQILAAAFASHRMAGQVVPLPLVGAKANAKLRIA